MAIQLPCTTSSFPSKGFVQHPSSRHTFFPRYNNHLSVSLATTHAANSNFRGESRCSMEEALHLFDELLRGEKGKQKTHISSFNDLFEDICRMKYRKDRYFTVISLFNRLNQEGGAYPNVYTYNILIRCCCYIKQIDRAFVFFGRLIKNGMRAETYTLNLLSRGVCVETGVSEATVMIFDKITKMGCEPDVFSYNILLNGLCKKGEMEKAEKLVVEMISAGIKPNVVTYSTLLNGFCKDGFMEKAEKLVYEMTSKGIKPDVVIYNLLVNGFCKKGATKKAEKVMQEMISMGIKENVVTMDFSN